MRKRRDWFFWWAAAVTAAAAGTALAGAVARVTFHFNPPDKTAYTETATVSQVADLGKGKVTQQAETVTRRVFAKTSNGFRMTATRVSSRITHDGKTVPDPLGEKMKGASVSYEFDSAGKLKTIRGYDEVAKRMRAVLPKEEAAQFTEEALRRQTMSEWAARFGHLVGTTLALKSLRIGVEPYPSPSGKKLVVYTATRVASRTLQGHACVVIRTDFNTDAKALAELLGVKAETVLSAKPPAKAAVDTTSKASMSGHTQKTVDPATLLPYAESSSRILSMPIPDTNKVGSSTETRAYTFAYGK